nr:MAG: hypothetical protein [Bacteriophage sp.]
MRDMLGFASHVEVCGIAGICGICGDMRRYGGYGGYGGYAEICGICGICGTDHLPEITPAGLPFLVPPPPIHEERETGTANDLRVEKKNAYFVFNLLIINHINQYFNIHLHLIRFITYNRRIFIAKYLFENKTCSIFVPVR